MKKIASDVILFMLLCCFASFAVAADVKPANFRLVNSEGQPIQSAKVRYQAASWYDAGYTDANGEVHINVDPRFNEITFRVYYEGAYSDIRQNINEQPNFQVATKKVNIHLKDSKGNPLEASRVQYQWASWFEMKTMGRDGVITKELLPGTYNFRMHYEDGRQQIRQNIGENPNVIFQTINTKVSLLDSKGSGLEGGKIDYARVSWDLYGHTNDSGEAYKELLPSTYNFTMYYEDGRQTIKQDITKNPNVIFQTINTKVSLLDSKGSGLEGGKIDYARVSWDLYGHTNTNGFSFKELLPSTYNFTMYYEDGKQTIKQNIVTDNEVKFTSIPVKVIVKDKDGKRLKNQLVKYARVTWSDLGFTDSNGEINVELIPSTYNFSTVYEYKRVSVKENISEKNIIEIVLPVSIFEEPDTGTDGDTGGDTGGDTSTDDGNDNGNNVPTDPENPENTTILVTNSAELKATAYSTKGGNVTVWLQDGTYTLTQDLWLTGDNITYKSLSGNREAVVIDGNYQAGSIFNVSGDGFTIKDVSIVRAGTHAIQIHGELDADNAHIKNVYFADNKEQMIKGSGDKNEVYSDNCIVEDSYFEFTSGEALQYYTGGIDVHKGRGWIVRNNTFKNIRRSSGGLTEGAIHFWSSSTDTIIENNKIINCDRGIMMGLDASYAYNSIVRNNFVHTTRDVGIYLCNAENIKVYNNTVFIDSMYPNAMEYRFDTTGSEIVNNLTNKAIKSRDGAIANVENNVNNAGVQWFADALNGDLHLSDFVSSVINKGIDLEEVSVDFDGEARISSKVDIGADEVASYNSTTVTSIELVGDRNLIKANGTDGVALHVKAVLNDGSKLSINPDSIYYIFYGQEVEVKDAFFTTYNVGVFELYARSETYVSNSITVSSTEVPLSDYAPIDIKVEHRTGQSFVTWKENAPLLAKEDANVGDFFEALWANPKTIKYNIYKSQMPIYTVEGLTPIGTAEQGSAYNIEMYNFNRKMQKWQISSSYEKPLPRFVIEDGKDAVSPNTGIFVENADKAGSMYYAVTVVIDGVEYKDLTSNTLSNPVEEYVAQGTPVLQSTETKTFNYIKDTELHYYVRWEAPPNASVDGTVHNYLVAIPPKRLEYAPVGVHLHCWGGTMFGGYGWWNNAEKGAIMLASNQAPYDWWTGYHENYYDKTKTRETWESGVVHPYTSDRMVSFLNWMNESSRYSIDMQRTFVAGTSMGGSGSLMMAIRYPEVFGWARSWVGVHIPQLSPGFKGSYANVYGKEEYDVKFEDGTKVWDYYNDDWYLRNNPKKEIGFLTFSNGKNDSGIGWEQAVLFYKALQETKRPHLFVWGQSGHSQRSIMPYTLAGRTMELDIRLDRALPAFTNCSLDDFMGNGDPDDGEPAGKVNAYLYWGTEDIVDEVDTFEMTVALVDQAPEDSCTVDITPRRLQAFEVAPNTTVHYQNVDASTGEIIAEGDVSTDENGLVTLESQMVTKNQNRIILTLQ